MELAVGPQSWKKYLHPPSLRLWQAHRAQHGFHIVPQQPETSRFAFIGVRSCELHAIAIQDSVFIQGAIHSIWRVVNSFASLPSIAVRPVVRAFVSQCTSAHRQRAALIWH